MASNPTSTGSPRKPGPPDHRSCRYSLLRAVAALAALPVVAPAIAAEPALLEPERAFAFGARALDERTVEARFAIADGYYLYRDKLRFRVEPVALAAPPSLPAGKVKRDEFFGTVETYRGTLAIRLPLEKAAPGQVITVAAESQGCADVGVCYPPGIQQVALTLPAPGAGAGPLVEAAPAKKAWFK